MTNADPHPPEHVLAELAESLGSDPELPAGAHVRGCESCQAVIEDVHQVRAMLHALPSQLPTPPDVSASITAALAAEATGAQGETPEAKPATVTPIQNHPVAWFRRRLPQTIAAAAAAAVIGLVGYSFVAGSPGEIVSSGGDDSAQDESMEGSGLTAAEDRPSVESEPEGAGVADGAESGDTSEEDTTGDDAADGDWTMMSDDVLALAVTDVWRHGTAVEAQCGETLADELGLELVGSSYVGADILVVLTDDADLTGWIVADCGTGPDLATEVAAVAEPTE